MITESKLSETNSYLTENPSILGQLALMNMVFGIQKQDLVHAYKTLSQNNKYFKLPTSKFIYKTRGR